PDLVQQSGISSGLVLPFCLLFPSNSRLPPNLILFFSISFTISSFLFISYSNLFLFFLYSSLFLFFFFSCFGLFVLFLLFFYLILFFSISFTISSFLFISYSNLFLFFLYSSLFLFFSSSSLGLFVLFPLNLFLCSDSVSSSSSGLNNLNFDCGDLLSSVIVSNPPHTGVETSGEHGVILKCLGQNFL